MNWHQFKVGDPVVCVDAEWRDPNLGGMICPLVEGKIYHIQAIIPANGVYRGGLDHLVFCLAEVESPYGGGFAAPRFRPVAKRATDISIFTSLLTPSEDDIIEIELLDFELERQFQ